MSYTPFGEFVRILRIQHHQVMGDMAKILEVPVSFLSAVENGRKNIPLEWIDTISREYDLNVAQQEDLKRAIDESKVSFKISTIGAGTPQRRAALQFARSFDEMDDDTAEKILALLKKQNSGGQ